MQNDDELLAFAYQNGSTAFHLMGPVRMCPGADPGAVADDQLRVHGLQGLRIADVSIMPTMPSANTYAATSMIAEKASDLIRRRGSEPAEVQEPARHGGRLIPTPEDDDSTGFHDAVLV